MSELDKVVQYKNLSEVEAMSDAWQKRIMNILCYVFGAFQSSIILFDHVADANAQLPIKLLMDTQCEQPSSHHSAFRLNFQSPLHPCDPEHRTCKMWTTNG